VRLTMSLPAEDVRVHDPSGNRKLGTETLQLRSLRRSKSRSTGKGLSGSEESG
jgi:hypothetical protein